MEKRLCRKCGSEKRQSKGGSWSCGPCSRERARKYHANNYANFRERKLSRAALARKGVPLEPLRAAKSSRPLIERLMEKVEPIPFSGCLIWTGSTDRDGYGLLSIDGKQRFAHRLSYSVAKGDPKNFVCHSCDVPSCINPHHLYDGTNSDNMQDRSRRGRAKMATGERHGNSVLTWDQVRQMRAMRVSGMSLKQIADAFEMKNTGHISNIVNHKIWRE